MQKEDIKVGCTLKFKSWEEARPALAKGEINVNKEGYTKHFTYDAEVTAINKGCEPDWYIQIENSKVASVIVHSIILAATKKIEPPQNYMRQKWLL